MAKIGVYICECGPNIKDRIDIDRVIEDISPMEKVEIVKRFPLLCSNDGKKFLEEELKKEQISHLVVAACSPKEHEKTFMDVCVRAGVNPYLLQMINIREQCAWMTSDINQATKKAIKAIRAGINRVVLHATLESKEIQINPDVLVIGGGIAGLEAALAMADDERKVYLVEKEEALGGMAKHITRLPPHQGTGSGWLADKITAAAENPAIEILLLHTVSEIRGFLGNFEVTLASNNGASAPKEIGVGAIVVATGFELDNPRQNPRYGSVSADRVLTAPDFEAMMNSGAIALETGAAPKSVALIHCVGREARGYCSKACCLYMLRYAHYLRDHMPDTEVVEIYSDLCLPHKEDQAYFEEAGKKGVRFIRTDTEVTIKEKSGRLEIAYTAGDREKTIGTDMAVLAPAFLPSSSTRALAEMLNIPLDESGFYKEVHELLNPIATPVEGVYITGCASGPKNIIESIIQAQAAAGKIFSSLIPGRTITTEARVCEVHEELCTGCQSCLSVCFYGAISFNESKGVSVVNEAICRGCGSCVGSCPSGAIRSKHFTDHQIYREVLEALR